MVKIILMCFLPCQSFPISLHTSLCVYTKNFILQSTKWENEYLHISCGTGYLGLLLCFKFYLRITDSSTVNEINESKLYIQQQWFGTLQ